MKWFKHYSNASENHKIAVIEERAGLPGYASYFKIIEMCASSYKAENGPVFTFSLKQVQNKLRMKSKQTDFILGLFSEQNLFQITRSENKVIIDFPKFLEIKDNHTKDLQVTSKQLAPRIDKIRKEKNRLDNNTEAKKILPLTQSEVNLKKPSPLSSLFSNSPEIQSWLDAGSHDTHLMLVQKFSHHELVELIEKAYAWAIPKHQRAEAWLYAFVSNKTPHGYGIKNKPKGNPYLAQIEELEQKGLA